MLNIVGMEHYVRLLTIFLVVTQRYGFRMVYAMHHT